jgi:hypothetical protein
LLIRDKIKEEKLKERLLKEELRKIKREEKNKIQVLRDSLKALDPRLAKIREQFQAIKAKKREEKLKEAEVRKEAREEARKILEAQKAEELLKQKVVNKLERYSRNMKSIVFQINKRYLTLRRNPIAFCRSYSREWRMFYKK